MPKLEIRDYALKSAGELSEAKTSCSLLISVLSIVPDFVVFAATELGAEATRTHALNRLNHPHTRSEYVFDILLRCFRPLYSLPGSTTNPDLTLEISRGQWYSVLCRAKARKINSGESFSRLYL